MIEFSGVSMDPKTNGCNVPGCANGACTSVWNYPGIEGRVQFNLCGWHVKELCERPVDHAEMLREFIRTPVGRDLLNTLEVRGAR